MNRFLTKRRAKKAEPLPKPTLDLSAALPPADDFRTSLILPNLSARFSMLREQDDPRSKLGKASDDSVLQPKRQSRLHEFGFVGSSLSDIAEVSSMKSSFKPPFADIPESRGSTDGYATDDDASSIGGMMSRPRPFEGNVLFGGRQKVYKVSDGRSGSGLRGRPLYDDDVGSYTFRLRQQEERERQELENQKHEEEEKADESANKPRSSTPSESSVQNFSRRRGTASSTVSTPSHPRSSTAATSINSQSAASSTSPALTSSTTSPSLVATPAGLERSFTKTRRLYENGLDQHMHEQQSSAMARLNSVQKQRSGGIPTADPHFMLPSKSAINLREHYSQSNKKPLPTALEPPLDSPVLSTISGTTKESYSSSSSPIQSHMPSPLSPVASFEESDPLYSALDPNDRGKATALGAFAKPQQQFDEHQYLQRQLEMQRQLARIQHRKKVLEQGKAQKTNPMSNQVDLPNETTTTDQDPNPAPIPAEPAPSAFSVFQNAALRMKSPTVGGQADTSNDDTQRTFFGMKEDGTKDDDQTVAGAVQSLNRPPQTESSDLVDILPSRAPPPILEHPALRSLPADEQNAAMSPPLVSVSMLEPSHDRSNTISIPASLTEDGQAVDSPTLGVNSSGLGGLIRTHLRNQSGQSSIYSAAPRALSMIDSDKPRDNTSLRDREDTPANSIYTHSNPWDLESEYEYRTGNSSVVNLGENTARSRLASPTGLSARERSRSMGAPATASGAHILPQDEPRSRHTRDASTATQAERDAFANELAQRQRAIQENLRMRAEIDNRMNGANPSPSGALKALSLLRSKSSKESFSRHAEPSSKALRMLGIENASSNTSSTSLQVSADADTRGGVPRVWESEDVRSGRSPPKASTRDRSDSQASAGRSRSRPGRLRADSDKTGEGMTDQTTMPTNRYQFDQSVPNSPNSGRSRSNSRAIGYFDNSSYLQPAVPSPSFPSSARLSPNPSLGAFSNPSSPGLSPRPSPGLFPSTSHHGPASIPYAATLSAGASMPNLTQHVSSNAFHFTGRLAGRTRKAIHKWDISEPTLIATTSVIDTVDLPPGASLRNGMDETHTPAAIRKKRFGFGRSNSEEEERPKRYVSSPAFGMHGSPQKRVEGAMF